VKQTKSVIALSRNRGYCNTTSISISINTKQQYLEKVIATKSNPLLEHLVTVATTIKKCI